MAEENKQEEKEDGILLYYKYAYVPNLYELFSFYESNCKSLGLLGRVRLAPHGVNVTVGGKLSSLEKHIVAVKSNNLFEGTDFKLASCSGPSDARIAKECGFTSLSIRIVKVPNFIDIFNEYMQCINLFVRLQVLNLYGDAYLLGQ